jgi:formylglycine-generating enzyme required for sulfatase activity
MKKLSPLFLVAVFFVLATMACRLSPAPTEAPPERPTQVPTEAPTPTPTEEPTPAGPPADASLGDTWTRPADGMVMVYVPAGEFQMGSDESGAPAFTGDEFPQHTVTLDGFWIDQMEVSVAQFRQFVTETGYETEAERDGWGWAWTGIEWAEADGVDWQHPQGLDRSAQDNHPVTQVSWNDVTAYCEWAEARLPTEAEWEYAARGPEGLTYPWGDEFDGTRLNFCDTNCPRDAKDADYDDGYEMTAPVGSYPGGASWCGASDMAGNVWEWVADWYGVDYYASSPSQNPTGPESGEYRLLRGGGWQNNQGDVRAANRYSIIPAPRNDYLGFRCVVPPGE